MSNIDYDKDLPLSEDYKEVETEGRSPLSKQQKISLVFLSIFSFGVIVFWGLQIRHRIYSPFEIPKNLKPSEKTQVQEENAELNPSELLAMDSDKDGLNNYDEMYVYKTSPYLEDSDSDGFNDMEEITHGTDPICPSGQDCSFSLTSSEEEVDSNTLIDDSLLEALDESQTQEDESLEDVLQDVLAGNSDPAVLRKLLLQSGMDKETLDKISDEDLAASYQEILNK